MRAIVFDGNELALRDGLSLRAPAPTEVVVRITHSGVCQSDVSVLKGTIPYPTPVVLGHEGAGVVEQVGEAVTRPAVGDHVVLSTLGQCGACPACDSGRPTMCRSTFGARPTPFTLEGQPVHNFANISSFAERVVVKANQAIAIPKGLPLAQASLIGCGVLTGTGAVFNRARVQPGERVAVLGVGGIGLNVIQAAALSGAEPIIAIDANPAKEALARTFGATHFVNAAEVDATDALKGILGGWGADHVFECVGSKRLIEQAIGMVDWGGNLVILGVPEAGAKVEFSPTDTYLDISILGCRYGTSRPQADVERIARLALGGRLRLEELVSRVYPFEDYASLLEDLGAGRLARGVLDLEVPGRA